MIPGYISFRLRPYVLSRMNVSKERVMGDTLQPSLWTTVVGSFWVDVEDCKVS